MDFTNISLDSFDLTNWTPAKDVRESVTIQLGIEELTTRQWKQLREDKGLENANIKGVWHVRYTVEGEDLEVEDEPTPSPLPAAKPNVVTFGDFSSSLAVVNNVQTESIEVHNTTFNTGALAKEADAFCSQLGAFTAFLTNTEKMLTQRQQELDEQTRIKSEALRKTQLQVENIKQRALLAEKQTIAKRVENESLDVQMVETVEMGKQLHSLLSGLSE